MSMSVSCKEALEDGVLRLLGGQAQRLQLQQLVAGDLADGRLVDQLRPVEMMVSMMTLT